MMQKYERIGLVAAVAITIGTLMIQSTPLALGAIKIEHEGLNIEQHISQANVCDRGASCHNTAQNGVSVNIPQVDVTNTVKIHQHIDQANLCSGEGTSCSNSGTNTVTLGASK
jgi:hypothetical protein